MGVGDVLHMFAGEIGIPVETVKTYRWVSSRWPAKERVSGVSHHVHQILASREDRFALIHHPPRGNRWTTDDAKREVGQTPDRPETSQEKVNRIHDLAQDDDIASRVATDLLRRPEVAFRAMSDQTARHQANRAQMECATQSRQVERERTPAISALEHNAGFLDLIGAGNAFVSMVSRAIPLLRGTAMTDEERHSIHRRWTRSARLPPGPRTRSTHPQKTSMPVSRNS